MTSLTAEDVKKAPVLRDGNGYKVVAEPPTSIGGEPVSLHTMISPTEVFGTVGRGATDDRDTRTNAVVIHDMATGRTKKIGTIPARMYVPEVGFSDRYVTWSEALPDGIGGPWKIKSFDRTSGKVRTIATTSDVSKEFVSLVGDDGGGPSVLGKDAIFVADASTKLPTTTSAYSVPLDGSSKPKVIAKKTYGAYPVGDRVALAREKEQCSMLDPATGGETKVAAAKSDSDCMGVVAGVRVKEEEVRGKPGLEIVQSGGGVTEIELPGSSDGLAYIDVNPDWVAFTFNDKAYVLDLKTKKLGRFADAQFVSGEQSVDNLIVYNRMPDTGIDFEPVYFVKLGIR